MIKVRDCNVIDLDSTSSEPLLTSATLLPLLHALIESHVPFWSRCRVVYRTERHTVSWINNYFETEKMELDADFVSSSKFYTSHLLTYADELKLVFRLRTKGVEGWTEYGISAVKVGDDFACRE